MAAPAQHCSAAGLPWPHLQAGGDPRRPRSLANSEQSSWSQTRSCCGDGASSASGWFCVSGSRVLALYGVLRGVGGTRGLEGHRRREGGSGPLSLAGQKPQRQTGVRTCLWALAPRGGEVRVQRGESGSWSVREGGCPAERSCRNGGAVTTAMKGHTPCLHRQPRELGVDRGAGPRGHRLSDWAVLQKGPGPCLPRRPRALARRGCEKAGPHTPTRPGPPLGAPRTACRGSRGCLVTSSLKSQCMVFHVCPPRTG